MPTFTTIALDRFLEPSVKNHVSNPPQVTMEKKTPPSWKKSTQGYGSPSLYRTPETTPIPDSHSSFPPSPYIINHKRRGASLSRGSSRIDVAESCSKVEDKVEAGKEKSEVEAKHNNGVGIIETNGHQNESAIEEAFQVLPVACLDGETSTMDFANEYCNANGSCTEISGVEASAGDLLLDAQRHVESEDFLDPQDSLSVSSNTEVEDQSDIGRSVRNTSQAREFYDAFEELSNDGASTPIPDTYFHSIEKELHAVRLNLLREVERRKEAEETFDRMKSQWQRVRQELSAAGILLPAAPAIDVTCIGSSELDLAEELKQGISIIRLVVDAVGRGCARAEVEAELEPRIESKNFEISRLKDRIRYYETMIHEMSQRNQEAVDMGRRQRLRRKRQQKWIWYSLGLAATLGGAAALAWFLPPSATGYWRSSAAEMPEDLTAEKA